jgi:hypothetical protein
VLVCVKMRGKGASTGEGKVVVLEVESYAGEVDDGFYACFLEFFGVADAGALEDEGAGEGAARDDDLFAGAEGAGCELL